MLRRATQRDGPCIQRRNRPNSSVAAPKCPYCGTLNSPSEARCFQCKQPLPGPINRRFRDLAHTALGQDLWVTKLFVGINVVSFLLMLLDNSRSAAASLPLGFGGDGGLTTSALLRAGLLYGAGFSPINGEWWRFMSAIFLHLSLLHLLFNMLWLVSLGRVLEPELGSARFVLLYLATGVGGFLGNAILDAGYNTGGASGSVFGLFGAIVGYSLARKSSMWREHLTRLVLYVVLSWALLGGGVNNVAHVGGAVAGIGLGYLFGIERRQPTVNRLLGYVGAVAAVLPIVALLLCQFSPVWRALRDGAESARGLW